MLKQFTTKTIRGISGIEVIAKDRDSEIESIPNSSVENEAFKAVRESNSVIPEYKYQNDPTKLKQNTIPKYVATL